MQIIYNGVDITSEVQPTKVLNMDNSGGKPDRVDLVFADPEGVWSKWNPAKNDTLQIVESGFDSGLMYIDQISQSAGSFGLQALSIPQISKTARSQGWESVRFMEFATQIAARYGFGIKTYGVINHLYDRVDQVETADFVFLAERCSLEGYALKINNESIVIYDEAMQEKNAPNPELSIIRESDIAGAYVFTNKSTDIYGKCIVRSQTLKGYIEGQYTAIGVNGPTLKRNLYASNQAEANRWAKGILRSFNKHMITATLVINLNTNYAAGTTVQVVDIGLFDGVYIIDHLTHDEINNQTKLTLRKPLEGY
ncbi:phage late control D family protein [Paenibacillus sp. NPDC058367]|uniref:phage late control D family protein n=1 Tax=Paenibacillus sp. NPDC058367 TaxID=3346460 RepID=UPI00364931B1